MVSMVKIKGTMADEEEGGTSVPSQSAIVYTAACRAPPLFSMRLARVYSREASGFHVTNARFWEAAFLPIAVVVVIAFSSCMDFFIGHFISLSCWYATNFYSMSYALQTLHPQITAQTPGYHCSPFAVAGPLWLWSIGIAALEMGVYHLAGQPKNAHAVGTTLYSICGCVWLHAVIASWRCIPPSWRPHKVVRYVAEHDLLKLPRWQVMGASAGAAPPTGDAQLHATDAAAPRLSRKPKALRSDGSSRTCAGHVALAIGGYGLLVAWWHSALGHAAGPSLAGGGSSAVAGDSPPQHLHTPALSSSFHPHTLTERHTVHGISGAAAQAAVEAASAAPAEGSFNPGTAKWDSYQAISRSPIATAVLSTTVDRSIPGLHTTREVPQIIAPAELQPFAHNGSLDAPSQLQHWPKEALQAPSNKSLVLSTDKLAGPSANRSGALPVTPPLQERAGGSPPRPANSSGNASGVPAASAAMGPPPAPAPPGRWAPPRPRAPAGRPFKPAGRAPRPAPQRPAPPKEPAPSPSTPLRVTSLAMRDWAVVLLVGCAALALLWLADRRKSFEFSVSYLVCFNLVCIRVPDLLGHVVITMLGDVRLYSSPTMATTAISFAYMGSMQAYIVILRWVCESMSSQHLFPRFQFVAQMYYYLFWYMMLMVVSPAGVEDVNFWVMVAMLNGNYLVSNLGVLQQLYSSLCCRSSRPDPPLKILFDSKMAVQDQLADVVSLLIVPAIATSFHICTAWRVTDYPGGVLISLWQRFGALLVARILSGLLTEEIFRRRIELLYKADAMELQLLPLDTSQNRLRYLNDICVGPKLAHEPMRNIERCELYFAAIAITCTFAVFQHGDAPTRYAFIAFGT